MRTFDIEYLSFEGNIRCTKSEGEDEDEAVSNAIDSQGLYSGDDILNIISVTERFNE